MIKPKQLIYGDKIAIVAPSGHFHKGKFLEAVSNLKSIGFRPIYRDDIFYRSKYLAGSDQRRADELNQYFKDASIKAIICARGGFGATRIIPLLDLDMIKQNPKIFIGFSDITSLLNLFAHKLKFITFHGPMFVTAFSDNYFNLHKREFIDFFINKKNHEIKFGRSTLVLSKGKVSGKLVGGNLSLIVNSIKTAYEIQTKNNILMLEDIDEEPYRIDRMMTHLKHAGLLENIKGLLIGNFIHQKERVKRKDFVDIFSDIASELKVPAIYDFPVGHGKKNRILPIGHDVTLDAESRSITFESPFAM